MTVHKHRDNVAASNPLPFQSIISIRDGRSGSGRSDTTVTSINMSTCPAKRWVTNKKGPNLSLRQTRPKTAGNLREALPLLTPGRSITPKRTRPVTTGGKIQTRNKWSSDTTHINESFDNSPVSEISTCTTETPSPQDVHATSMKPFFPRRKSLHAFTHKSRNSPQNHTPAISLSSMTKRRASISTEKHNSSSMWSMKTKSVTGEFVIPIDETPGTSNEISQYRNSQSFPVKFKMDQKKKKDRLTKSAHAVNKRPETAPAVMMPRKKKRSSRRRRKFHRKRCGLIEAYLRKSRFHPSVRRSRPIFPVIRPIWQHKQQQDMLRKQANMAQILLQILSQQNDSNRPPDHGQIVNVNEALAMSLNIVKNASIQQRTRSAPTNRFLNRMACDEKGAKIMSNSIDSLPTSDTSIKSTPTPQSNLYNEIGRAQSACNLKHNMLEICESDSFPKASYELPGALKFNPLSRQMAAKKEYMRVFQDFKVNKPQPKFSDLIVRGNHGTRDIIPKISKLNWIPKASPVTLDVVFTPREESAFKFIENSLFTGKVPLIKESEKRVTRTYTPNLKSNLCPPNKEATYKKIADAKADAKRAAKKSKLSKSATNGKREKTKEYRKNSPSNNVSSRKSSYSRKPSSCNSPSPGNLFPSPASGMHNEWGQGPEQVELRGRRRISSINIGFPFVNENGGASGMLDVPRDAFPRRRSSVSERQSISERSSTRRASHDLGQNTERRASISATHSPNKLADLTICNAQKSNKSHTTSDPDGLAASLGLSTGGSISSQSVFKSKESVGKSTSSFGSLSQFYSIPHSSGAITPEPCTVEDSSESSVIFGPREELEVDKLKGKTVKDFADGDEKDLFKAQRVWRKSSSAEKAAFTKALIEKRKSRVASRSITRRPSKLPSNDSRGSVSLENSGNGVNAEELTDKLIHMSKQYTTGMRSRKASIAPVLRPIRGSKEGGLDKSDSLFT